MCLNKELSVKDFRGRIERCARNGGIYKVGCCDSVASKELSPHTDQSQEEKQSTCNSRSKESNDFRGAEVSSVGETSENGVNSI